MVLENFLIHLADMECFHQPGIDENVLHCESLGNIDQKKSKTKLEFSIQGCEYEIVFQSPYYAPVVPEEEEEEVEEMEECSNGGSPCGDNPCCLSCCYGCNAGEDSCDD